MLRDEKQFPLKDAADAMPPGRSGKKCHFSTIWRWVTKGALAPDGSRVRLEAFRRPGVWMTSAEAMERFFARITPHFESDIPPRTPTQRAKASARAALELEKAGI